MKFTLSKLFQKNNNFTYYAKVITKNPQPIPTQQIYTHPLVRILSKDQKTELAAKIIEATKKNPNSVESTLIEKYLPSLVKAKNIMGLRSFLQSYLFSKTLKKLYPRLGSALVSQYIAVFIAANNVQKAIKAFKSFVIENHDAITTQEEVAMFDVEICNVIIKTLIESDFKHHRESLAKCHGLHQAVKFYKMMQSSQKVVIVPTSYTINLILRGYAEQGAVEELRRFYKEEMIDSQNLQPTADTFVQIYKVHVKAIQKSLKDNVDINADQLMMDATKIFIELMPSMRVEPNLEMYSYLIRGYAYIGDLESVFQALDVMKKVHNIDANIFTFNSLLEGLSKAKKIKNSTTDKVDRAIITMVKEVLNLMVTTVQPNLRTYTIVLDCFFRHNMIDEAMDFFYRNMQLDKDTPMTTPGGEQLPKIKPNDVTFTVIISELCKAGEMEKAERVREIMIKNNINMEKELKPLFIAGYRNRHKMNMMAINQ
jgi:pentatricopeptide repeat protein